MKVKEAEGEKEQAVASAGLSSVGTRRRLAPSKDSKPFTAPDTTSLLQLPLAATWKFPTLHARGRHQSTQLHLARDKR